MTGKELRRKLGHSGRHGLPAPGLGAKRREGGGAGGSGGVGGGGETRKFKKGKESQMSSVNYAKSTVRVLE